MDRFSKFFHHTPQRFPHFLQCNMLLQYLTGGATEKNIGAKIVAVWYGERGSASLWGLWGLGPQQGPGAEALVRGSGAKTP